jgi:hypothetical protein
VIDWVKYLLPSGAAGDTAIFNKWASGRITTGEAIKRMKKNNNMPHYVNVEPDEWVRWVNGLGYRRSGYGTQS